MSGIRSSQTKLSKTTMPNHPSQAPLQAPLQADELSPSNPASADLVSSDLSKRELQIVELVSAGLTNQEISAELAISKRTVDNHVSNVLTKTATGNRVALVRWALQSGKVCIDELNCCRLPEK